MIFLHGKIASESWSCNNTREPVDFTLYTQFRILRCLRVSLQPAWQLLIWPQVRLDKGLEVGRQAECGYNQITETNDTDAGA